MVKETKIDANKGDIAEALLGAAMCATFATRPFEIITNNHVNKILNRVLKTESFSTTLKVPDINKRGSIEDNITFNIAIPKKAIEFLKEQENRHLISDLYTSVLKYVNENSQLQNKAAELYKNNTPNKIIISSVGTVNQKETKADIIVNVDGKPVLSKISLKVTGGEQFAQFTGARWETQQTLFIESLGLDISKVEKSFKTAIKEYDQLKIFSDRNKQSEKMKKIAIDATRISYSAAALELNKKINTSTFKQKLAKFIRHGATLDDPNITLIKLTGGSYISQSFKEGFNAVIQGMKLSYIFNNVGNPTIFINGKIPEGPAGSLIRIRAKAETPSKIEKGKKIYTTYIRNYIEADSDSLLYKI